MNICRNRRTTWQSEGQTVIGPFKRRNEFHFRPTQRSNTQKMNGNDIPLFLFFFCLNGEWKGSPPAVQRKRKAGPARWSTSAGCVQSFRWATNGSVSHHFSILAAQKLFLPLVWWRPPFIWCNWKPNAPLWQVQFHKTPLQTLSPTARHHPYPLPPPSLILLGHLFASASNSSSCSEK